MPTHVMGRPTGDAERFSSWLNAIMHRRGLTGAQLARQADVSTGMVSRWRRGLAVPSPQSTEAIANVLSVPVGEAMVQAGHILPGVRPSADPVRGKLHDLVDRLPMELIAPYISVFEAILAREQSDER